MTKSFSMLMLLALAAGCSFHARSPDEYRDATQALLDTKSADIKTCYDDALKGKSDLAGTVTVHFTVEAETGKVEQRLRRRCQDPSPRRAHAMRREVDRRLGAQSARRKPRRRHFRVPVRGRSDAAGSSGLKSS